MMRLFFFLVIGIAIFGCNSDNSKSYEVSTALNAEQQKALLHEISRYIGELPKRGSYDTRNDSIYNAHYQLEADKHTLKYYYNDAENATEYFLVTRIAPSIHEKYVALGGKLKRDNQNNLVEYEELFRTWKFPAMELEPKAKLLFDKMVKGEDLSQYYADKAGDQYIEFPNSQTQYDKNQRRWVSINNPLDSLYKLRNQMQTATDK